MIRISNVEQADHGTLPPPFYTPIERGQRKGNRNHGPRSPVKPECRNWGLEAEIIHILTNISGTFYPLMEVLLVLTRILL
jgi:hypothetical protein